MRRLFNAHMKRALDLNTLVGRSALIAIERGMEEGLQSLQRTIIMLEIGMMYSKASYIGKSDRGR